jgi:predicted AAA+ superfamily ATPase
MIVTGARQVGKTTLLRQAFHEATYVTFDNLLNVESARDAPGAFLSRFTGPVILDEIQYVPSLFSALKERIDADRDNVGRWLLIGSQRFDLMKNVSESLAGRIAIFHLESLSALELRQNDSIHPEDFALVHLRGGYPELWKSPAIDRAAWFEDYVRTYIERDLQELVQVKDLIAFRRFLGILAARAGELVNYSNMGLACGVSNNTIKNWLSALEVSGVVYIVPPFFSNLEKRLVKSPKIFFADTGLLSALLGIASESQFLARSSTGHIWENFVFCELVKNGSGVPGKNLFFFRDHAGVELDFVIDSPELLTLVEAKYSERIRPERLAFDRVAAAFPGRLLRNRVAAPTGTDIPLPMNGYDVYDPRYSM